MMTQEDMRLKTMELLEKGIPASTWFPEGECFCCGKVAPLTDLLCEECRRPKKDRNTIYLDNQCFTLDDDYIRGEMWIAKIVPVWAIEYMHKILTQFGNDMVVKRKDDTPYLVLCMTPCPRGLLRAYIATKEVV